MTSQTGHIQDALDLLAGYAALNESDFAVMEDGCAALKELVSELSTTKERLAVEEEINNGLGEQLLDADARTSRLAEAILENAEACDYCIACGCHPSHGHAAGCAALAAVGEAKA